MEFNTVSISDGITMGSQGMKASLISRDLIADSIELVARGNLFDGLIALSGCDKTIPGTIMALARLDIPGLMLYGGSIAPGQFHGRNITIQDVFEAVGAHAAGRMTDADLLMSRTRRVRAPAPAAVSSRRTPCRRSASSSAFRRWASTTCPRSIPTSSGSAARPGALVMDLLKRNVRPRQIITREAIENAIASVAATGGSTNAVLHLLAIAREAGVALSIDDFDRISAKVPLLADLKPSGRFVATDMYKAGGARLIASGSRKPAFSRSRRRRSPAGRSAKRPTPCRRPTDQEVVRPLSNPMSPNGGLAILHGNLAPEGAVVKIAGKKVLTFRGHRAGIRQRRSGVRGGRQEPDQAGRRGRHPLRRTEGRPWHARDAGGDRRARRGRVSASRWRSHRRPFFRRDTWIDGGSRGARGGSGGPIAAVRDGDAIVFDIPNRQLRVELSDEEISARMSTWKAPAPHVQTRV